MMLCTFFFEKKKCSDNFNSNDMLFQLTLVIHYYSLLFIITITFAPSTIVLNHHNHYKL